ncbi:MAG: hypothetical protein FJ087_23200 [Deltaproteobacteria bacterium]|nr:hypothetical protein [Deltaproteobacteria bacterium]
MKQCPKCKRTWPDTGKFCPMDGSHLEPVVEEEPQTVKLDPAEAPVSKVAAAKPAPKVEPVAAKPAPKPAEPAPAAAAAPAGGKPAKKPRTFSETKWFMVGEAIEEKDLDPEMVSQKELQKQYRATTELPADVRKKFSLTYGQEEKKDKGDRK